MKIGSSITWKIDFLTNFNNILAEININSSVINIGYELCNKFNL